MVLKDFRIPEKKVMVQKPMMRVCYALIPVAVASIYFFGWRSFFLLLATGVFGIATEAVFTFRQNKPVTSAVFVTILIFYLSLPPTTPFWMAVIGIIFGVSFGKMVFGGFGQNVFNPAMVGRCFLYITFPIEMTNRWVDPMWGGLAGFLKWSSPVDSVTMATPLTMLREGASIPWYQMLIGNTPGSLGETSALVIIFCGAWLLYKKAASWRLAGSCLLGGIVFSTILHYAGAQSVPSPIAAVLSGSFLFGTVFIVTEPISGAKTKEGQWIYGFFIGSLIIVLRGFSNFSEGVMFSVLLMNAFVPLLDQTVQQIQAAKKARASQ